MHLGVDPGLYGAIAAIDGEGRNATALAWDIPRTKDKSGHAAVDVDALADLMAGLTRYGIDSLYVEEPFWRPDSSYKPGEKKLAPWLAMHARINSGVIWGMAKMVYRGSKLVQPVIWKRATGIPVGAKKDASVAMAKSIWPGSAKVFRRADRAEAALIAFYGMRAEKILRNIEGSGVSSREGPCRPSNTD